MAENRNHIVLIHWDEREAADLAAVLEPEGWSVLAGSPSLSQIRAHDPSLVLISLRRLPSHGRDTVEALRKTSWGKDLPVLFFGGTDEAVELTHRMFPGIMHTTWDQIPLLLASMIRDSSSNPSDTGLA